MKGLKHVHDLNIIHRDLKPENIFLYNKNKHEIVVKLGDFGLSIEENLKRTWKESNIYEALSANQHSNGCGTPMYIAPEQNNQVNYDEKVDMFSLGLILFELTSQINTHHEKTQLIEEIRFQGKLPQDLRKNYPTEGKIIKNLCQIEPKKRWSAKKLIKSHLMKQWEKELSAP